MSAGTSTVEKKHGLHYGWIIVAVEFILTGICVGTLINCMGVFVKPVSESLGIERSKFTLVITISSLVSTAFYPFWGSYMKTGSIRRSYIISAVVIPLVFLGYSYAQKIWQFYLISAVMGFISASVTTLATSSMINRWFIEKRGLALSLASSGSGFLPSLFIPKVTELIEQNGWRYGFRWLGVLYLILVMLCAMLILRDRPERKGLKPYGHNGENAVSTKELSGVSKAQAMKSSCFYLILVGAFLCGLIYNGVHNNIQAYLTDIGYSAQFASRVVSISMLSMVFAKLAMGPLFDRFGFGVCFATACAGTIIAALCLFAAKSISGVYIYAVAFGITASFPALCCSYSTMHFFGSKDFSAICGFVTSAMYLGLASGSTVISAIYDFGGSYTGSWILVCVLTVLNAVMFSGAMFFSRKTTKNV